MIWEVWDSGKSGGPRSNASLVWGVDGVAFLIFARSGVS